MIRAVQAARGDLDDTIAILVEGYTDFVVASRPAPPCDSKEFTAFHAAGRAALAHIEHLAKILRTHGARAETPDRAALLSAARADIEASETEEAAPDDAEPDTG
ncbi:MAG TPA: hypothetical protein VD970_04475 [Acetobacteraceae bacterium]|nr:hypothetical protein [Acetobacteraceae bacterium]